MAETPTTCIDPYLNSFIHSLAEANYQAVTIKTYRNLLRMLGRLMDANGIAPSALTPKVAVELARMTPPGRPDAVRLHHLARRFAQHLLDIGVVPPVPVTEAEALRTAILAAFELYMAKQRGLSPRPLNTRWASQGGSWTIASAVGRPKSGASPLRTLPVSYSTRWSAVRPIVTRRSQRTCAPSFDIYSHGAQR